MRRRPSGKVLVTGAAGFIGSRIVSSLVDAGRPVVALQHRMAASPTCGASIVTCDLTSRRMCRERISGLSGVHSVVHCAALMPGSTPRETIAGSRRANFDATINLLTSLPAGITHFIFLSSIDVYGPPRRGIISESHPLLPSTWYGVFKLASEAACRALCSTERIKLAIIRPSQVYGEGEPIVKVIPRFITAALAGASLIIRGDGRQKRTYIFVGDVATAVTRALERGLEGTYNLGGARAISIGGLARMIIALSGSRGDIVHREHDGVYPSFVIDSHAIRAALKLASPTPMEEGLRRQIAWVRKNQ
jgi:UDP-glucose 4-epimerase